MKTLLKSSVLLLFCMLTSLVLSQTAVRPKEVPHFFDKASEVTYPRFRISAGGGYSARLYTRNETASEGWQDFSKDLNSGVNGDLAFNYFYTREFGVSALLNTFHASTSEHTVELPSDGERPNIVQLKGNANITFLGVAGTCRYLSSEQKHSLIFNIGLGRYIYNEKGTSGMDYKIKGNCFAALFGAGYDYYFNDVLGAGLNVNYSAGTLRNAKADVGNGMYSTEIESGNPLNRIDFALGVRVLIK